jgi:hypothetical protein
MNQSASETSYRRRVVIYKGYCRIRSNLSWKAGETVLSYDAAAALTEIIAYRMPKSTVRRSRVRGKTCL